MRKFIAELAEAVVVGLCMGVLLVVLRIELATWHFAAIAGGAMLSVSLGGWVRKAIATGQVFYNYEWKYQYDEHEITVKAGKEEELYINGELADKKTGISLKNVELQGRLGTGETVKAVISGETVKNQLTGERPIRCEVFVDGKPL